MRNPYRSKVIYTGRRVHGNKVYHRFEDFKTGKERLFLGVRGCYIGYVYEAGAKEISRRPRTTDDPRVDNPKWEAEDALADEWLDDRRREARMRNLSKPHLEAAATAMMPLARAVSMTDIYDLARVVSRMAMSKCLSETKKKGKGKS